MSNKLKDSSTLNVVFDGSSSSLVVDLALPPINKNFNGNLPSAVINGSFTDSGSNTITFTGTFTGSKATLSCTPTPAAGSTSISLEWEF